MTWWFWKHQNLTIFHKHISVFKNVNISFAFLSQKTENKSQKKEVFLITLHILHMWRNFEPQIEEISLKSSSFSSSSSISSTKTSETINFKENSAEKNIAKMSRWLRSENLVWIVENIVYTVEDKRLTSSCHVKETHERETIKIG